MFSRDANLSPRSISQLPGADLSPMERLKYSQVLFKEMHLDELMARI